MPHIQRSGVVNMDGSISEDNSEGGRAACLL